MRLCHWYFNSRLCMRGNNSRHVIYIFLYLFQFTPLHERQQKSTRMQQRNELFQFTPLHERQLWALECPYSQGNFNSRLCMRGNPERTCSCLIGWNFNSRLCMRGNGPDRHGNNVYIYFNSRLCMRGNFAASLFENRILLFQFTPLHERQLDSLDYWLLFFYFNSRLCMRGNHFPKTFYCRLCLNFNSRLCMRGNLGHPAPLDLAMIFQFTPLHERQRVSLFRLFRHLVFQFTPLHERQRCYWSC